MNLLVTGGAGFIGSNFIHWMLARHPDCRIVNLDKLTYAGNLENLQEVEGDPRCRFLQGDICDPQAAAEAMAEAELVVNFAAESHVDRSIEDPEAFLRTNIMGVHTLLLEARRRQVRLFMQVSTDEVYGSIAQGAFAETDPLTPSSPYSASKAAGELLARSFWITYGLPVLVTRATNNIGPYQYPEKVVPLFATNALQDLPLPLYGDGQQQRDYLHVADHCAALDLLLSRGQPGEIYNIGADNHLCNLDMARLVLEITGKPASLLQHVADRPGHDRRYAVNSAKLRALGWAPRCDAQAALRATVRWYMNHPQWWQPIKSGARYQEYYRRTYAGR